MGAKHVHFNGLHLTPAAFGFQFHECPISPEDNIQTSFFPLPLEFQRVCPTGRALHLNNHCVLESLPMERSRLRGGAIFLAVLLNTQNHSSVRVRAMPQEVS